MTKQWRIIADDALVADEIRREKNLTQEQVGKTDTKALLSVIVPVYQAQNTLEKCVGSVLAQTYSKLELLLVDDGSSDGGGVLCDQLQQADTTGRIRVRHSENHGVSHARNLGLEMAQGDWICFVDADDVLSPQYLEKLMQGARQSGALLVAQTEKIRSGKQVSEGEGAVDNCIVVSGNYFLENAVLNSDTHVWSKLYRKDLLRSLLFPEQLTIGEDMLFLLKLSLQIGKEHKICCIPGHDYLYTENAQGAMNRAYQESYLDQIFCWQQAEELLAPHMTELSPYIYTRLAVIQIMASLLVAGKLACAAQTSDVQLQTALDLCSDEIRHALRRNGAFAGLSIGYKCKVLLFRMNRNRYLKMYGNWKKN